MSTDELRGLLDASRVLEYFGIKAARRGRELRTHHCPKCGQRSRDSVCINASTGMWHCKVCSTGGDIFDAIAGYGGTRDFVETKRLAMAIAGVAESSATHDRKVVERQRDEAARREQERKERDTARVQLQETWDAYDRRSVGGERYLENRGISSQALRHIVRHTPHGCPALPMHDTATGVLVGIQYRRIEPDADPKVLSVRGSTVSGSALCGRPQNITAIGPDVVVLVEGFADTLVAHLAWPGCVIFGAPGADQLRPIAEAIAPKVKAVDGWLLIVPHDDLAGVAHATKAVKAAQRAGLVLDRDLHLVDLGNHNDLADAWRAGWRPSWPTKRGGAV